MYWLVQNVEINKVVKVTIVFLVCCSLFYMSVIYWTFTLSLKYDPHILDILVLMSKSVVSRLMACILCVYVTVAYVYVC